MIGIFLFLLFFHCYLIVFMSYKILSLEFLIAGDVAFKILDGISSIKRRANQDPINDHLQEETQIHVCDINPNMLNVGRKRAIERGMNQEGSGIE